MFEFNLIDENVMSLELKNIKIVNKEELNFINSNKELGFIYIELNQFNDLVSLIYRLENKITLKEFLKEAITIEQANSIIKDLVLIKDISFTAINIGKIFLDLDKIFVDKALLSARLKFLYLPITLPEGIKNNLTIDELAKEILLALNDKREKERLLLILNAKSIKSVSKELTYLVNEKYSNRLKKNINSKMENINSSEVYFNIYEENKKHGTLFWNINYLFLILEIIFLIATIVLELYAEGKFTIILSVAALVLLLHTLVVLIIIRKDKGKSVVLKKEFRKEFKKEKNLETEFLGNDTVFLNDLMSRIECYDGNVLREYNLSEYNLLGRNIEICNIVLENKSVSKVHASIKKKNEYFYLMDENSSNGTYVNNKKLLVGEEIILKDNDEIMLGNVLCIFRGE